MSPERQDGRILPATHWASLVVFVILVPALVVLWGLPMDTGDHWAWMLRPDLSPIFLGAGYGAGTWDLDCKAERQPVTITAEVRKTADGIPRIDFYPQMRFSPKQAVMLLLYVPGLTPESNVGDILYCATASSLVCVNEAAVDPVLATYRDYDKSSLYRRIKHFSGYLVSE